MKKVIVFLGFFSLFIFSCSDPGGDPVFDGFTFSISNKTNRTYNAKMFIGGVNDNLFSATDSIEISNLRIGNSLNFPNYFVEENRWKPDLDKIRNLPSSKCYFKLRLFDTREEVIEMFESTEYFRLDISDGKRYFTGYYGKINIYITDSKISGDRHISVSD
jgi:hypothetical protein